MKKIFSFFAAMMLLVSSASATTIYCKMDKSWWKADGAAVGIYTWNDGGTPKVAWPGERMTPVEGEADVWSFDLDLETYHMCIFTRVNGSGDIADFGAKTGDLTIPTDGKNLFTITSETAVWGDPGVVGVWSVYGAAPEEPTAAPAAPTAENYQVKAIYSATYNADCNFGEWSSGTVYTQEAFGKKFVTTASGYFGLEFAHKNCSEMEALHLDVWVAANAQFDVYPIWGGTEQGKTVQLVGGQWNSIDIALSEYNLITDWSGVYQIKIANAANLTLWLNNVYFYTTQTKTIDLTDGYYMIGSVNDWDLHNMSAAHKFAVNPDNEAEYKLHYTLAEGDEFKVVAVANNGIATWYPAEAGNYVVDFAHKGEKDIYFRPDYQGGEDWHAACIYVPGVDLGPIVKVDFKAGGDWHVDEQSTAVWNAENQSITVNIVEGKQAQWQAQVWYQGPIAKAGKYYALSVKFEATQAVNGVTLKYQENAEMTYDAQIALEANTPLVYTKENLEGVDGGSGVVVFDFGFAPANTVITISNISIVEKETKVVMNFPTANCPADNNIEMVGTFEEGTMAMEKIIATGWFVSYNRVNAFADNTFKFRDKTNNDLILCKAANGDWVQAIFTFGEMWQSDSDKGTPCMWLEEDLSDASQYAWMTGKPEPQPEPEVMEYYLVGNLKGWEASEDYKLTLNPENEGEYMITTTVEAGEGIKILGVQGETQTYFPSGTGNEYVVAEALAGTVNIYFRPEGGVEGWYEGYFYVEANGGAGIDNTAVDAKAVKMIKNGMLLIIKGDKTYNVMGQIVK